MEHIRHFRRLGPRLWKETSWTEHFGPSVIGSTEPFGSLRYQNCGKPSSWSEFWLKKCLLKKQQDPEVNGSLVFIGHYFPGISRFYPFLIILGGWIIYVAYENPAQLTSSWLGFPSKHGFLWDCDNPQYIKDFKKTSGNKHNCGKIHHFVAG